MKILIALDASPHSERALDFVTRMRWPPGSRAIVLSVVPPTTGTLAAPYEPAAVSEDLIVARREQLLQVVARAKGKLRGEGFCVEGRVADGDPREGLIEIAHEERVDLIVMGSHGRTGVRKLLLGSVSSHVVTHAPCSVLVVKEEGRP